MKVMLYQQVYPIKPDDPELICKQIDERHFSPFFAMGTVLVGEQWNFEIQKVTVFLETNTVWYENFEPIMAEEAADLVINFGWEYDRE